MQKVGEGYTEGRGGYAGIGRGWQQGFLWCLICCLKETTVADDASRRASKCFHGYKKLVSLSVKGVYKTP